MLLRDKIPSLYHVILEDLLLIEIPEEKLATCNSCLLCQSKKSPYLDVKCCTYFPKLSNYLVGAILTENEEVHFSNKKARDLISQKRGVTPYGLVADRRFNEKFEEHVTSGFDFLDKKQADELRCPFLSNEGNCGIWAYRENLCISFFCSSSSGNSGFKFWEKLNKLMILVENTLGQYFMKNEVWAEYDIRKENLDAKNFTIEDEQYKLDLEVYKNLWKDRENKEIDFYKLCYQKLKSLTKADFLNLAGEEFGAKVKELIKAARHMKLHEYPDFLVLNPNIETVEGKNGYYQLKLGNKKMKITNVHYLYLKKFDGKRSTTTVMRDAYKVFFNMNHTLDQLLKKKMLIAPE